VRRRTLPAQACAVFPSAVQFKVASTVRSLVAAQLLTRLRDRIRPAPSTVRRSRRAFARPLAEAMLPDALAGPRRAHVARVVGRGAGRLFRGDATAADHLGTGDVRAALASRSYARR